MHTVRPLVIALGALLLGASSGCFSQKPHQVALFDARPRFTGPTGDDVVQMDVAFIERPPLDRYLNTEVWADADEQTLEPEQKVVLRDNGFRIGQIGGNLPPGELKELLTSNRTCVDPRRISLHARQSTTLVLGPTWKKLQLQLVRNGQQVAVDVPGGQCLLDVMPLLTEDGRTTLRFTPRIRYGQTSMGFAPQPDPSGALRWERHEQQPEETYSWLSWEVTAAPNEYVVVGTHLQHLTNLGQRCFLLGEDGPRVQRLLVIRTSRDRGRDLLAGATPRRALELAEQAQGITARGSRD